MSLLRVVVVLVMIACVLRIGVTVGPVVQDAWEDESWCGIGIRAGARVCVDYGDDVHPCSLPGFWWLDSALAYPIAGDTNRDGVVDVVDMLAVLGAWGWAGFSDCREEDIDRNCVVDVRDFLVLLSRWGRESLGDCECRHRWTFGEA